MRAQITRPRAIDTGLAAVLAVIGVAEVWVPFTSVAGEGSAAVTTGVSLVACASLAWRRRAPFAVTVVAMWVWPLVSLVTPLLVLFWGQFVPMAVALFSVARHGRGRTPYLGAAVAAVTLLFFDLFVDPLQEPGEIAFHWLVFTVTWSLGFGLARYEDRARASLERAVAAEVTAAEQAMQAVVEERTRIARELHDVVAHAVSVMVVQAGAARQVVDDDPEQVRRSLDAIRSTGAEALDEMRRVVTLLREEDGPALTMQPLEPQPGLASLPRLLDDVRATGLSVTFEEHGTPRPMPAGLDLAAFRVVQEALTNVRKHARASTVRVTVSHEEDVVALRVRDDGVGCPPADGVQVQQGAARDAPAGHGLVGIRERVAMYGGEVVTGAADGGGFEVLARLPRGLG